MFSSTGLTNTSRLEPSVGARRERYTYNRLESSPDSVIIYPLPGLFVSLADTCSRALCAQVLEKSSWLLLAGHCQCCCQPFVFSTQGRGSLRRHMVHMPWRAAMARRLRPARGMAPWVSGSDRNVLHVLPTVAISIVPPSPPVVSPAAPAIACVSLLRHSAGGHCTSPRI